MYGDAWSDVARMSRNYLNFKRIASLFLRTVLQLRSIYGILLPRHMSIEGACVK